MVLRITIIVMLFVAAVLAFAATKPKTFHLRRSITIKAAPDKVFALVNDLHKWNDWSAEDSNDPNIQRTFGGAAAGERPEAFRTCPGCRAPLPCADANPRILKTRAGEAEWPEPEGYCDRCRRAFFPSVQKPGHRPV